MKLFRAQYAFFLTRSITRGDLGGQRFYTDTIFKPDMIFIIFGVTSARGKVKRSSQTNSIELDLHFVSKRSREKIIRSQREKTNGR